MSASTTARSAYPSTVEALLPRARHLADLTGALPSLNRLKAEFRIGTDKARAVRDALATPAEATDPAEPASTAPARSDNPDPFGATDADHVTVLGSPLVSTVEYAPPSAPGPDPAQTLTTRLATERAVLDAQRSDQVARRASAAEHRRALADVAEWAGSTDRGRQERARDAVETERLAALYRRATRSGARARVRTQIQGSAEMRALRIARVRTVTLAAGGPVLAAFAAWSTAGVQAGVVRLLDLRTGVPGWWAAWGMEPALMTVVALIIIGRAVLRSAGGDTDRRADIVEWTALITSLALNTAGGWNTTLGAWSALGATLAHSVGPLGAAGTAYLIALFDGYVTTARPWDGALTLTELGLAPSPTGGHGPIVEGARS